MACITQFTFYTLRPLPRAARLTVIVQVCPAKLSADFANSNWPTNHGSSSKGKFENEGQQQSIEPAASTTVTVDFSVFSRCKHAVCRSLLFIHTACLLRTGCYARLAAICTTVL